jgi:hypothetical protein
MVDLQKASLTTNGNQVTLTMPISKVDVEKRIVSGFATLDNIDRQGDRVTAEASRKAFENFRGNVRLMHQPIPAGKVVNFRTETFFDPNTNKQYSGVYVDTYVSKGAQEVWEMVLDGTLTGFSIGGNVKDSESVLDGESKNSVRIIKDYDLVELSLVDSPANHLANIFSIQKTDSGDIATGIFNKSNIQNVFWCEVDELAYVDENESHKCANCDSDLTSIGWIDEVSKEDIAKAVFSLIQKSNDNVLTNEETPNKYPEQNELEDELLKAKYKVGDFVQWNSSGGTARGKVTRVVTNGTIKVPNSDFTITGTQENPAVAIRVYQKDGNSWKPSDTTVGHRMNTLRSWATKVAKSLGVTTGLLPSEVVKMAVDLESVAYQQNEGGVEVAENTEVVETNEDIIKSDEVAEDVVVDEVVEESAEIAEEAPAEEAPVAEAPTEESVEKSDSENVEATVASTDNGEVTDMAKALDEIKNFISETISTNTATNTNAINEVATSVAEVTKALADKNEELNKALADVKSTLENLNSRVDSVESDTAVKKSGELENAPEQTTVLRKSVWGGRFLGSAEYLN